MKLLLPILLTTSLFAQDKSNQISYTIETTTGYYQNISIALVDDASIEVYYRNLKDKFKIPIAEIKSLKQNGLKSDQDATFIGTLGGGFVGLIAVAASPKFFKNHWDKPTTPGYAILTIGGVAGLGNLIGSNFFKSEYKVVEFRGWSLDKKRNYLKSIVR